MDTVNGDEIFKLNSATYSTIDGALAACDSAKSGSKPLANYLGSSITCQDKVHVFSSIPDCGTEAFTCSKYDAANHLFVGNYGSDSSCGYQGKPFLLQGTGWAASATGELLCVSGTF